MAVMPGVIYNPVVSGTYPKITRYDIVCIHTIVGFAPASAAHFSTKAKGQIIQNRDTKFQSAANLNGNYRVIAIENEDHGEAFGSWSGSNVPAFTKEQCESIAQICVWANKEHKIPLWLCPNSRPIATGVAYHRQGIDGNFQNFDFGGRVFGGENWSKSFGKVCPGDRRIHQLIDIIIPRARIIAGLDRPPIIIPKPPIIEDDMFSDADRELLKTLIKNSQQLAVIDTKLNSLLGRPLPVDIRNDLLDIQRAITNTSYAINGQASWEDLGVWNEVSDLSWGNLKLTR